MGIQFLDLGKQPLANGFLTEKEFDNEFFFNLTAQFDTHNYLVSLGEFVPPEKMFNESYAYTSSCSQTMIDHFMFAADRIKNMWIADLNAYILEIGSNDGVFIRNFNPHYTTAVEPCANFAKITNKLGYKTYNEFWSMGLSEKIVKEKGRQNIVYSANCMCHIQDVQEAFSAVHNVLHPSGRFIFEDPSLLDVIKNDSYDQFYDEHAHIFSLIALEKLLNKSGFYIDKVEHLDTHGGSNRIYATKFPSKNKDLQHLFDIEYGYGLDKLITYFMFAERVQESKNHLLELFYRIRSQYKHIIGYGATSKSSVVYNYCGITPVHLDYIIDTTPVKQGKFSPGTHIPIIAPQKITQEYAFLGAWNYKDEICSKEKDRKFKFITHVPKVTIF